jgi:hypothetical protein
MIRIHDYQRLIIGYHGCDEETCDRVISGKSKLGASKNDYDWLGNGMYFWEHGPQRARAWAQEQKRRGRFEKPAVLGAVLHLGQCFDLLDAEYTEVLTKAYPQFCESLKSTGKTVPKNEQLHEKDEDKILRKLDCAVINWTLEQLESETRTRFHSVRGVFQEGGPVYPGSDIQRRSHIQIAVRDAGCILGYFLPNSRSE